MYIENKLNPGVMINLALVSSVTKEKLRYYTINFCFSATSEEFYPIWRFKREEDRDVAWDCLKQLMSVTPVGG